MLGKLLGKELYLFTSPITHHLPTIGQCLNLENTHFKNLQVFCIYLTLAISLSYSEITLIFLLQTDLQAIRISNNTPTFQCIQSMRQTWIPGHRRQRKGCRRNFNIGSSSSPSSIKMLPPHPCHPCPCHLFHPVPLPLSVLPLTAVQNPLRVTPMDVTAIGFRCSHIFHSNNNTSMFLAICHTFNAIRCSILHQPIPRVSNPSSKIIAGVVTGTLKVKTCL